MNKNVCRYLMAILLCMPLLSFASSDIELDFCAELKIRNTEMQDVLAQIRQKKRNDDEFLNAMKSSQKVWNEHVEAELIMQFPSNQRSDYGSVFPICLCAGRLELIQNRIEVLKQWLQPEVEGDVCIGSKR